ncbi:MAG: hypothetical protein OXH72_15035 [Caldilineaceae bacterium]|nr:hypothetical protein [Caldilineaceae bacterium]
MSPTTQASDTLADALQPSRLVGPALGQVEFRVQQRVLPRYPRRMGALLQERRFVDDPHRPEIPQVILHVAAQGGPGLRH